MNFHLSSMMLTTDRFEFNLQISSQTKPFNANKLRYDLFLNEIALSHAMLCSLNDSLLSGDPQKLSRNILNYCQDVKSF